MIKKTICIKNIRDISNVNTYNLVTGITISGSIEHYTGQTQSDAIIGDISILLTQKMDDLGYFTPIAIPWESGKYYISGETVSYNDYSFKCLTNHLSTNFFDVDKWELTPINDSTGTTINLVGNSNIELFRRFGKTNDDPELYNPYDNTGFTRPIYSQNGMIKQITGEHINNDGLSYQPLYDYKIWNENNTGHTLNYSDIGDNKSLLTFNSNGLNSENSVQFPCVKLDYLIGVVDSPKIEMDVFIDRGVNSSFEQHMRLGDINSLTDLEKYGNGYFKIKEY